MMGGLLAHDREKQGYEFDRSVEAGLPMPVWVVDLEIERERDVTAAELAVLRLIDGGVSSIPEITKLMGMGTDERLAEGVVVRLLTEAAIDRSGTGFALTDTGRVWKAAGHARGRERVTHEVRFDPVHDTLEWVDHERPVYVTGESWTIDLGAVDQGLLLQRKAELGALVRDVGLPGQEEGSNEARPLIELRSFYIVSQRVHWRRVRLDFWRHPVQQDVIWIGHMGDAENPPLTQLVERHIRQEERRWLIPP